MLTQPTRPPLVSGSDPLPMAPRHLWSHLTADQQRPVLQVLVRVGQELVARATAHPGREEADD